MKTRLSVLLIMLFPALLRAQTTRPTTRPVPAIQHAIIFSIDGLRPDVLLRADTPTMHGLMKRGSFTMWARSTVSSITLPTHVSMLTGASPESHGILFNGDLPLSKPVYPKAATLFELAKQAGYSTAMVAGKSKFSVLEKPGTIDFKHTPTTQKSTDDAVTPFAVEMLREHTPDVMFVHLPTTDTVGHKSGWGSQAQLDAVAKADRCIGQILDTVEELKRTDSTLVIVTSDHGGAGRQHGPEDPRSRHVPWIVAGPGIRKNFDLTLIRDLTVEPFDTFTVVCTMLDIPVKKKVNGKFIPEILANYELLQPTAPPSMNPATNPTDEDPQMKD